MKYPIGIQDFNTIIENGYAYVDLSSHALCVNFSSKTGTIDDWQVE